MGDAILEEDRRFYEENHTGIQALHAVCHARSRILIYSYGRLWQPLLRLAETLGLKYRQPPEAWLPPEEIKSMLALADSEVVREDRRVVFPAYVPLVSELAKRYLGHLLILDHLSLMFGIIARPAASRHSTPPSAGAHTSAVIPCRNEAVSRFRHGWLLLQMSLFAERKPRFL